MCLIALGDYNCGKRDLHRPVVQHRRRNPVALLTHAYRRRSIRTQLLVVLIALSTVAWIVGGAVTILQARKSTRIEINAAMELAEALVRDAIPVVRENASPREALAAIPTQIGSVRHVRMSVTDASGVPISSAMAKKVTPPQKQMDSRPPAPEWFAGFIAPPVDNRSIPVFSEVHKVGSIVLSSAPGDEIAEVWENATGLAKVAFLIGIASIAVLYLLFGRVLAPLKSLAAGLLDLGRSDYNVRLSRPTIDELALITDRFNALAIALNSVRAENRRLNKRLIAALDDERRQVALDLHDEVGPYLFGLKANTASIASGVSGTNSRRPCSRDAHYDRRPSVDKSAYFKSPAAHGARSGSTHRVAFGACRRARPTAPCRFHSVFSERP